MAASSDYVFAEEKKKETEHPLIPSLMPTGGFYFFYFILIFL